MNYPRQTQDILLQKELCSPIPCPAVHPPERCGKRVCQGRERQLSQHISDQLAEGPHQQSLLWSWLPTITVWNTSDRVGVGFGLKEEENFIFYLKYIDMTHENRNRLAYQEGKCK